MRICIYSIYDIDQKASTLESSCNYNYMTKYGYVYMIEVRIYVCTYVRILDEEKTSDQILTTCNYWSLKCTTNEFTHTVCNMIKVCTMNLHIIVGRFL